MTTNYPFSMIYDIKLHFFRRLDIRFWEFLLVKEKKDVKVSRIMESHQHATNGMVMVNSLY